ncbi:unnamed protein product [Dovyalis caffra]|uniref:DNA primase large subunit C-terminal domain-containing protein n=1 Tax=Dovyalis caffra TaxID=77055 RepID=A0AAV1RHC0_9ROSI|nr:unnamed protein product [Dovyalis caffra]
MEIVKPQWRKPPLSSNDAVSTLPLYRSAPSLEVRLEDFELYAIDRLRVLKGISDGLSRGKRQEEMEKLVKDLWKANMRHPLALEVTNKDIISHFVLRLVYCRTEELRKWFLANETALFRYRFWLLSTEAQRALMAEFDLPYKPVTTAEFEDVKDKLQLVARSIVQPKPTVSDAIFYKVPFEEVPELVAGRRVFICKGYAYVALNQVVSLLVTQFRGLLSKALVLTNRKWTSTIREQEKDRLTPIVEALCTSYLGPDYSQPKEFAEISIKDLDQVAKSSFPLCMRHLFEKLREDHHLKHGGRMQLGLFLKLLAQFAVDNLPSGSVPVSYLYLTKSSIAVGVGLKLDDALAFWKAEFSRKTGAERFDKEYAYGIRHNYGREGKRTENLKAALSRMGVNSGAVETVMDKVQNRHYQLACTLTFEAIHGLSHDAGINHPNQYFSDSQKILKSKHAIRLGVFWVIALPTLVDLIGGLLLAGLGLPNR